MWPINCSLCTEGHVTLAKWPIWLLELPNKLFSEISNSAWSLDGFQIICGLELILPPCPPPPPPCCPMQNWKWILSEAVTWYIHDLKTVRRHSNPKEREAWPGCTKSSPPLIWDWLLLVTLPALKLFLHLKAEVGMTGTDAFRILCDHQTGRIHAKCKYRKRHKRNVYTNLWFLIKAKISAFLNENFWLLMWDLQLPLAPTKYDFWGA